MTHIMVNISDEADTKVVMLQAELRQDGCSKKKEEVASMIIEHADREKIKERVMEEKDEE